MIQKTLYQGNGVSITPIYEEGRTASTFVRLVADEGKELTNGTLRTKCVDTDKPSEWTEVDETPTTESLEELTTAELKAILSDMGVSATMNKANMIRLILAMEESS